MKSLLRGTFTLVLGASTSRAIGLLSIPVLTRLYSPEAFGTLGLFMAVLLILTPLATLRYLTAIPLPRHDRTAFAILALSVGLAASSAFIVLAVLILYGGSILDFFALDALIPYYILIPLGLLFASLFETFTMWATRNRAYPLISKSQIWQVSLGEGLKVLFGLIGAGTVGLLIGQACGYGGGLRSLISRPWTDYKRMALRLRKHQLLLVARRFRAFPLARVPAQLVLTLATQAPLFLTQVNYGLAVTGQIAIAIMVITLPVTVIGQAASRAFYSEAARRGVADVKWTFKAFRKLILILSIVSIPFAVILFLFAEPGAVFILGQEWAQAGRFSSVLALALVPQFAATIVQRALDLLEAHTVVILFNSSRLVLVYLAFTMVAGAGLPPEKAVFCYSVALGVHSIIQVATTYAILRRKK